MEIEGNLNFYSLRDHCFFFPFFFLFYLFLIVFLSWQLNGDQYNLDSSCAAILCSSQSFGSEI